jgi:hypothetical protein
MKQFNLEATKEKWFDYDEDITIKFLIKPFPLTKSMLFSSSDDDLYKINWVLINYSLIDWEGLVDIEDKKLECNTQNKEYLYSFEPSIVLFILKCIDQISGKDKIFSEKKI